MFVFLNTRHGNLNSELCSVAAWFWQCGISNKDLRPLLCFIGNFSPFSSELPPKQKHLPKTDKGVFGDPFQFSIVQLRPRIYKNLFMKLKQQCQQNKCIRMLSTLTWGLNTVNVLTFFSVAEKQDTVVRFENFSNIYSTSVWYGNYSTDLSCVSFPRTKTISSNKSCRRFCASHLAVHLMFPYFRPVASTQLLKRWIQNVISFYGKNKLVLLLQSWENNLKIYFVFANRKKWIQCLNENILILNWIIVDRTFLKNITVTLWNGTFVSDNTCNVILKYIYGKFRWYYEIGFDFICTDFWHWYFDITGYRI